MPDKFYALLRSTGFFRYINLTLYPLIRICKKCEFRYVDTVSPYRIKLVWRQSEFAFFVRRLRSSHFFFGRNYKMKKTRHTIILLSACLCICILFTFVACKKSGNNTEQPPTDGLAFTYFTDTTSYGVSGMPAKNKTNLAKTPLFSRFLSNSHLKYV